MARRPRLSEAAANIAADAVTALVNGGTLRIYDGTQPSSPDIAVTKQTLLAELRFASPAFLPATKGGTAEARDLAPDDSANGGGQPTWFRAFSAGDEPVFDGSAGEENANLLVAVPLILPGTVVRVMSLRYTQSRRE